MYIGVGTIWWQWISIAKNDASMEPDGTISAVHFFIDILFHVHPDSLEARKTTFHGFSRDLERQPGTVVLCEKE